MTWSIYIYYILDQCWSSQQLWPAGNWESSKICIEINPWKLLFIWKLGYPSWGLNARPFLSYILHLLSHSISRRWAFISTIVQCIILPQLWRHGVNSFLLYFFFNFIHWLFTICCWRFLFSFINTRAFLSFSLASFGCYSSSSSLFHFSLDSSFHPYCLVSIP